MAYIQTDVFPKIGQQYVLNVNGFGALTKPTMPSMLLRTGATATESTITKPVVAPDSACPECQPCTCPDCAGAGSVMLEEPPLCPACPADGVAWWWLFAAGALGFGLGMVAGRRK